MTSSAIAARAATRARVRRQGLGPLDALHAELCVSHLEVLDLIDREVTVLGGRDIGEVGADIAPDRAEPLEFVDHVRDVHGVVPVVQLLIATRLRVC
jgi:hypothetical protein